jgi:hypothetical protein
MAESKIFTYSPSNASAGVSLKTACGPYLKVHFHEIFLFSFFALIKHI